MFKPTDYGIYKNSSLKEIKDKKGNLGTCFLRYKSIKIGSKSVFQSKGIF